MTFAHISLTIVGLTFVFIGAFRVNCKGKHTRSQSSRGDQDGQRLLGQVISASIESETHFSGDGDWRIFECCWRSRIESVENSAATELKAGNWLEVILGSKETRLCRRRCLANAAPTQLTALCERVRRQVCVCVCVWPGEQCCFPGCIRRKMSLPSPRQ